MTIWSEFLGLPVQQTFYSANGIRTRVLECGAPNSKTLIMLHGTGGHAEAFAKNLRAHAEHFRVIAMDMIGHGFTDAPPVEYTMATFVNHLADMVDTLGCEQVDLCGESLGGMVAAHYAIQHPARVRKLVLNTALLMRRTAEGRKQLADLLARSKRAGGELTRDAVRTRMSWLMHDPAKNLTGELVEIRYQIYAQPGRAATIAKISQEIVGGLLDDAWSDRWSNEEHLERLQCPVLLIWSKHNPGNSPEHAQNALRYLRDGKMVVLDDCGHWPQWEQPDAYNRAQLDFLLR